MNEKNTDFYSNYRITTRICILFRILKKKELLKLAIFFEKSCVDNSFCTSQPVGWSCYTDGYCYDKDSKYPEIGYKTRKSQQNFELSWKIATGTTLIATGGVKEKIVVRKQFD